MRTGKLYSLSARVYSLRLAHSGAVKSWLEWVLVGGARIRFYVHEERDAASSLMVSGEEKALGVTSVFEGQVGVFLTELLWPLCGGGG